MKILSTYSAEQTNIGRNGGRFKNRVISITTLAIYLDISVIGINQSLGHQFVDELQEIK